MQEQSSAGGYAAHHPTPPGHPHACVGGFVYLGYVAEDPETGEETEYTEQIPCRRCAEDAEDV